MSDHANSKVRDLKLDDVVSDALGRKGKVVGFVRDGVMISWDGRTS